MNRKLGVLISGRGSNLKAIIDAIDGKRLDASIAIVISNRADAPGLEHAIRAGIETLVLSHKSYASREDYVRQRWFHGDAAAYDKAARIGDEIRAAIARGDRSIFR